MDEKNMPSKEALLKDLELQWKDHFHMRDQSWKTLTNTSLFLIGAVGLEIKEKAVDKWIMVVVYVVVTLTAIFGVFVAFRHHKLQKLKFALITEYEKELGLWEIKGSFLDEYPKTNVAFFIAMMEFFIAVVALILLIQTIRRRT